MNTLAVLVKRNVKLFFKDKGLFFVSLITPLILLVLYATFLGNVYADVFWDIIGEIPVDEKIVNGLVGGQLLSSLIAVCAVTVAFCANMLMVQDKISGARVDMLMTPVKKSELALGYYIATAISAFLICMVALAAGLIYVAFVGWYLSVVDVLLLVLDVLLLVMFGTALSSCVNHFLSNQGQISAVGSLVSSVYGFICGAYMPISSFSEGLQVALSFLPGTYGTSLVRAHATSGALEALGKDGVPSQMLDGIRDSIDANLYFLDGTVPDWVKYVVLAGSALLLVGAYVLLTYLSSQRKKKSSNS